MKNRLTMLMASLLAMLAIGANAQSVSENGVTATWPFDNGTGNATGATLSNGALFSATAFSVAADLTCKGSVNPTGGSSFTMFEPGVKKTAASPDDAVTFTIIPKKGLTFTPTSISLKACKVGTSGGSISIDVQSGKNTVTALSAFDVERNNTSPQGYSDVNVNVEGIEATAGNPLTVTLYIFNLNTGKQVALKDIVVTGNMNGTMVAVPSYTLTASSDDAGAGSVTVNPDATSFDEGTVVTVSANENFGCHFSKWVDAGGNEVSDRNPYTFSITANTTLKAVYTRNNVYALNLKLTDGARSNLVEVAPAGNLVNGTHYYEEGTEVMLKAADNAILTFLRWDDNTTDKERSVVMNSNVDVTATFSACDYIVGWDFYNDAPASQRAADYAANTENSGLLSLRDAAGNTISWLAMGVNKGGQNGRYGARIWKPFSNGYYFEASFSTLGYENVVIDVTLGDDYNTRATVDVEYSTDGTGFSKIGSLTLPVRSWTSGRFELPAGASNQPKVWVRFVEDATSEMVGQSGDYDGLSITDIFVTGNSLSAADETAPVLVSSIPANEAGDASANGSIILTFDEKVAAGSGTATLNGEPLSATFSGKSVVFAYSGLAYNTAYTFEMPAGFVTDRNGNAADGQKIVFTTMERTRPEARLYDMVVAQDGTGDYTTIQAAIDAAPANQVKPFLIFVKAGIYKEHIDIPVNKPYLHIIGAGYEKVSIEDDKLCGGDNALDVSVGATVVDRAANGYFEGVSFVNSYGRDKNNGPQALALYTMNDRVILNRCGLVSYQDTWLTTKTMNYRHYAKDCFIEGAVDFIYGQGNVYFDACTINIVRKSGGYIVAPNHSDGTTWGYVFMNNRITAPGVPSETDVWLGRPWHEKPMTVFINTVAEVTIPATGWYPTMGGLPKLWADYNTMDANGNPVDLSNRQKTYYYTDKATGITYTADAKNRLTDEEAAQYTVKNVLSGSDNWQPAIITERCAAPAVACAEGKVSWEAVDYAICYVVEKDGNVVDFVTGTEYAFEEGSVYAIYAVNEFGGLSEAGIPSDQKEDGTATAVHQAKAEVAATAVYSLDGRRQTAPVRGINIVESVDRNGNRITQKVIVR